MIDLVIFDCDGVLVDSEIVSCRAHAQALTQYGHPITADQVRDRFVGRSAADCNREIESELGRALPDDFDSALKAIVLRELAASLEPMPHIDAALAAIEVPVCVASSGFPEKIRQSLRIAKLSDRFGGRVFSAAQVERGKPAPDLFLLAAQTMQAVPAHCVVIEDSASGVTAGVAAGMTVFGFTGGSHCRPDDAEKLKAAGARLIFDDMRELPTLLERQKSAGSSGFKAG